MKHLCLVVAAILTSVLSAPAKGPVPIPSRIQPAVELSFTTQLGAAYQIYSSANMQPDSWLPYGDPFRATDTEFREMISIEGNPRLFFKVTELTSSDVVQLGEAVFDSASTTIPLDSPLYSPPGTYDFLKIGWPARGSYQEVRGPGGMIAGVETIKVTMNDPDQEPHVEEQWLAVDVLGNLRLLKDVEDGEVDFEANATITPPVFLPVYPQVGYTALVPYNGEVLAVLSDNATLYGESGFLLMAAAEAEADTGQFGANLNYFKNGYGWIAERSMWSEAGSETVIQGYIPGSLVASTYQVYGADYQPNSSQAYHPEQTDFAYLGSSSSNATFTGSHEYYIIHAPEGSFIDVDCVQGSNGAFYYVMQNGYVVAGTEANMHTSGEPDGQTVQLGSPSYIIIDASGDGLSSISVKVLEPNLD